MRKFSICLFGLVALVLAGSISLPVSAQQAVSPCVRNVLGGCAPVETYSGLPVVPAGVSFANIDDNSVTELTAGVFAGFVVNTGGTNSVVTVHDGVDDTGCNGTLIGTFVTTAQVSLEVGASVSTGLCVTTTGDVAADITILYR